MNYIDLPISEITSEKSGVDDLLQDSKQEIIKDILEEKKEKEQKYIDLIKRANFLFKERKYEEAKLLYKEASDLFPKYPYPKDKIVEINNRLDKLERKKAEDNTKKSNVGNKKNNAVNKKTNVVNRAKKDLKSEFENILSKTPLDIDNDWF